MFSLLYLLYAIFQPIEAMTRQKRAELKEAAKRRTKKISEGKLA